MTDISFKEAIRKVGMIYNDFKEITKDPENIVEKSKGILSSEILVDESDFIGMYGVSFKNATQEQRDEYIGIMKVLLNVTRETGKAVTD